MHRKNLKTEIGSVLELRNAFGGVDGRVALHTNILNFVLTFCYEARDSKSPFLRYIKKERSPRRFEDLYTEI